MDKIKNVAQRLGIITVEDMERYTALELIMMIANKMNEFQEIINDQNDKIQYLLNGGTLAEVIQIFDEWLEDGTFDTLINQTALTEVNERIDETNAQLSEINDKVKFHDIYDVSELKRKNLKINDKVRLLNFYNDDDIHHKRVISSDDDGTGVLLDNGLYANLLHDGIINIKWLGITSSDNGTRDYVNQQSDLFNKLSKINKHGINKIEIPAGWYRFGKTLILPKTSTFTLEGQADTIKSVNFLSYTDKGEYLLSTDPSASIDNQTWGGLTIKGIRFSGFRQLLNSGVKIHYAPWIKFDNVLIEGFSGHGLELGKIEDSEFNKLSIFQCGRSSNFTGIETETIVTDGDITNSTHYALYLNNGLIAGDANNMIRFIDCRFERNRSYPYVMSDDKGAFWVNFYGLHSEIGSNHSEEDNIIFMIQGAGVTTFNDCHIDNFAYQVGYYYGEIYASNCRYMSLRSMVNGVKGIKISLSNCNSDRLKLGVNDGLIRFTNGTIGDITVGQTNTKTMISNSNITNLIVQQDYNNNGESYAYLTNCYVENATFETDSAYISVCGGRIVNLSDGSKKSMINAYVDNFVSGYNKSQPTRVLSSYGNVFNLVSDKYPEYHNADLAKDMAKGGVVWNTDFTTNKFAGWVYNPATGGFEKFGPLL